MQPLVSTPPFFVYAIDCLAKGHLEMHAQMRLTPLMICAFHTHVSYHIQYVNTHMLLYVYVHVCANQWATLHCLVSTKCALRMSKQKNERCNQSPRILRWPCGVRADRLNRTLPAAKEWVKRIVKKTEKKMEKTPFRILRGGVKAPPLFPSMLSIENHGDPRWNFIPTGLKSCFTGLPQEFQYWVDWTYKANKDYFSYEILIYF